MVDVDVFTKYRCYIYYNNLAIFSPPPPPAILQIFPPSFRMEKRRSLSRIISGDFLGESKSRRVIPPTFEFLKKRRDICRTVSAKPWIIVRATNGNEGGTGHNARISHIVDTFTPASVGRASERIVRAREAEPEGGL